MKLLIQVGNMGGSIIDHLIRPLAAAESTERALLVARRPGPHIPKAKYYTPPRIVAGLSPMAVLYEFFMLLRLSKSEKPRCIVGYKLFPHALMTFLVAKLTGHALVVSLIAGPLELFSIGSPTGVTIDKPLSRKGRFLLKILEQSDAVVTTGSFTKGFLMRQGLQEEKIHPIIHTPSPSQYYPMEIEKEYDVISVGRLAPVKHTETLLHAISEVKQKKNDIRVCIVGDGPRRNKLLKLAAMLDIEDNVEFVGFQKNVATYYNKSRIFVLTSEREGFPNVLLEAMMCGLPSVVSNCGDVVDLAIDGHNSIVIPKYNDYEGFAEAIAHLLNDSKLSIRLSQNALKTTRDFSIERATREWQQILCEVSEKSSTFLEDS